MTSMNENSTSNEAETVSGQPQDEIQEATDFWIFGYGSLIWKPPPHYDERVPGWVEGYVRRFWQESEDHRGTPEYPGRVVTLISRQYYVLLEDPDPEPTPQEAEDLTEADSNQEGALVHQEQGGRVWGAAYHIPKKHAREVLEYLDVREQNGYSMERALFFPCPPGAQNSSKTLLSNISGSSRRAETHISLDPSGDGDNHDPFICLVYIGLPSNPQFIGPQDPEVLAQRILDSKGPSGENREYLYELETALMELCPGGSGDRHIGNLAARCRRLEMKGEEKKLKN